MKENIRSYMLAAILCAAGLVIALPRVEALVLRGQFPIQNGMYWNFADNDTKQTMSWVMQGRFALSGIGSVRILNMQGDGFVALKEKWDGLYLCGEYRMDGHTVPDRPIMFMPFEIDFDKPIKTTSRMRVYGANDSGTQTGEYDQTVTITLQGVEDITFESREIRNCAVIKKETLGNNGTRTIETFWLVPSIGPVKMSIDCGTSTRTYILQSYRTDRGKPPQGFVMEEYFPLKPGTVFAYRDQTGENVPVKIGKRKEKLGWQTITYTEPCGDVYYLTQDERGVVFPIKFTAAMSFASVCLPPDIPQMLLPNTAATGKLNHSLTYLHPAGWPSLDPMLDFYPESEIASIILGLEDVIVPAGTYRDCIKLYISSVTRSFNMQREKIRVGIIWLARGVGEIKREGMSFANAYLEETTDYVFQTQQWELTGISQADFQGATESGGDMLNFTEPPSGVSLTPEALVWQGNSRVMFDTAVDTAPFFVRGIVRKNLMEALYERVDASGIVTEDAVIAGAEAASPEMVRRKLIAELEQMRTR